MALFSVFLGLIYNEFFGMPLNLFDSCYQIQKEEIEQPTKLIRKTHCFYPIGIDPIWAVSSNNL